MSDPLFDSAETPMQAQAEDLSEVQPESRVLVPWSDDVLAIVPMRNLVLFPHALMPVSVGRAASIRALDQAIHQAGGAQVERLPLGFVLQKDPLADEPQPQALCEVGTRVRLMRDQSVDESDPQSGRQLMCMGLSRFRVRRWRLTQPFLLAEVEPLDDEPATAQAEAAALQLRERVGELLGLLPGVPAELVHAVQTTRSLAQLGDGVAALLDAEVAEKQQWLEMTDTAARLERILRHLEHRIQVLKLSQEIGLRTREQLQDRERRALLREQLQAIRKELGEEDTAAQEVARLRQRLDAAGLPEAVAQEVSTELQRLAQLPAASSEHAQLLGWLQWVSELPWALPTRQAQPVSQVLEQAQQVLDADHAGLPKVKRELLEHLAVRALQPQAQAPILCFVGPPGVGKTSLGQSVARALGRPFGRISLGGVHDESEIRGHRRTYVGALPGVILQTLKRCGSRDALIMLDEIDKLSTSGHGDPTAAMLEVLDPAQNHAFRDHYLGLPFDLSAVMFVATANVLTAISPPLRDRLDVIELSGYTTDDKLEIARRHLLPRLRQSMGLASIDLELGDELLIQVIEDYTREAGVRQLERTLARLLRHTAWQWASQGMVPRTWTPDDLLAVLGPPRTSRESALRRSLSGVATGLAWTPAGGDILFIEASKVDGSARLLLTGQLGDVMKESAQAALTLVKAHAGAWGLNRQDFETCDVHLHVPAGAIPKDGPSAGVAMFLALASLFTGKALSRDVAVTGEISLRGLVLPVGGIRDKVLAAARAGIRRVLLPVGNRADWAEIPPAAQQQLQVQWVETVDEALQAALSTEPAPEPSP